MVWRRAGPEEAAEPSHPSNCQHLSRQKSPVLLHVPALPLHLGPLSPPPPPSICRHTHPCSTVAEHCNFSTAAVFACHKSDTPLALLSLPPSIHPSIHSRCIHLPGCCFQENIDRFPSASDTIPGLPAAPTV